MTVPHVPELLILLVIILLIFGAGKLPEVAGSMGKAIREFRRSTQIEESSPTSQTQSNTQPTNDSATSDHT